MAHNSMATVLLCVTLYLSKLLFDKNQLMIQYLTVLKQGTFFVILHDGLYIYRYTFSIFQYTFIGWVWGGPAAHLYQVYVLDPPSPPGLYLCNNNIRIRGTVGHVHRQPTICHTGHVPGLNPMSAEPNLAHAHRPRWHHPAVAAMLKTWAGLVEGRRTHSAISFGFLYYGSLSSTLTWK